MKIKSAIIGLILTTTLLIGVPLVHAQNSPPTLWLSLSNVDLSSGHATVLLRGTVPGARYNLRFSPTLGGNWTRAGTVTGASNQDWTAVSLPMIGGSGFFEAEWQTNLWLEITGASNAPPGGLMAFLVIHPPWGASNGVYDVFGTTNLASGNWFWAMRCRPGQTALVVSNQINPQEFFILGGTNSSDGDLLSDAYDELVAHVPTNNPDASGDGLLNGWEAALGLNPLVNNLAQGNERSTYTYDLADRLRAVTGARNGTINLDNEGNVLTVSQ